jgi:hypothetical protein
VISHRPQISALLAATLRSLASRNEPKHDSPGSEPGPVLAAAREATPE